MIKIFKNIFFSFISLMFLNFNQKFEYLIEIRNRTI